MKHIASHLPTVQHDQQLAQAVLKDIFARVPEQFNNTAAKIDSVTVKFHTIKDMSTGPIRSAYGKATIKLELTSYQDSNSINQI